MTQFGLPFTASSPPEVPDLRLDCPMHAPTAGSLRRDREAAVLRQRRRVSWRSTGQANVFVEMCS